MLSSLLLITYRNENVDELLVLFNKEFTYLLTY